MPKHDYWHTGDASPISAEYLSNSRPEFQKDVMREWFFQNYEDPAMSTPYESEEGYIYIWGGPFSAGEELVNEFSEIVPEAVIEELVEELETESIEWAGKPSADDLDDYYFYAVQSNTEFNRTLVENLNTIEALLKTNLEESLQQPFLRLLHINAVAALETFLSDAFINTVISQPPILRKFVETNPDFKDDKLPLSKIYIRMDGLEKEIRNYLIDLLWHNLEKIKPMYRVTLDINFPDELGSLFQAIKTRHDLVHRNGKTQEGKEITISRDDVKQLLENIRTFGQFIDEQFNRSKS